METGAHSQGASVIKTPFATGALLLGAGCGGPAATPETTPTPTHPPMGGGAFASPADLITKAGTTLPCSGENWSVNAPETTRQATTAKLGGRLIHVKRTSNC